MSIIVHNTDAEGMYAGQADIPDRFPGQGLPAWAYLDGPPDTPLPSAWHRWKRQGDAWVVVEDHRGRVGWMSDGTPHTVTTLGPLPDGWSEVEPPRPAGEIRAGLLAAIGACKNALRDGGFLVDGTLWDSDAGARLAYAELAQRLAADPAFTTRWKASEGQWVTTDGALFARVYAAGAAHIAAAFAWQEAEEARLAATPDAELGGFVVGA